MALSYGNTSTIYRGPVTLIYTEITFDSSYAAGGETVDGPKDFGLATILGIIPIITAGWDVTYKKTNTSSGTFQVFASLTPDTSSAVAAPLEASTGRDVSSIVVSCIVVGR